MSGFDLNAHFRNSPRQDITVNELDIVPWAIFHLYEEERLSRMTIFSALRLESLLTRLPPIAPAAGDQHRLSFKE